MAVLHPLQTAHQHSDVFFLSLVFYFSFSSLHHTNSHSWFLRLSIYSPRIQQYPITSQYSSFGFWSFRFELQYLLSGFAISLQAGINLSLRITTSLHCLDFCCGTMQRIRANLVETLHLSSMKSTSSLCFVSKIRQLICTY